MSLLKSWCQLSQCLFIYHPILSSQFSLLTLNICPKMRHSFLNHIEGHAVHGLHILTFGHKAEGPGTQNWTDCIYIHLQMRSVFMWFRPVRNNFLFCWSLVHWETTKVNFLFHKALTILLLWTFAFLSPILKGTFGLILGVML